MNGNFLIYLHDTLFHVEEVANDCQEVFTYGII